jgi:phosphoglycerate dehydrogenase-like enzyme
MNNKLLVLVRDSVRAEIREVLGSFKLPNLEIIVPDSEVEIKSHLSEANIILGVPSIAKNFVNQAPKLVWLQSTFAGIDALIKDDLRKDYLLTNVREVYGTIMAEYVFAYILMFHKDILGNLKSQTEKIWDQKPYKSLEGISIGILGTGSIGQEIAKVAKSFGMKTIGYNTDGKKAKYFDITYSQNQLAEFLQNSQYVISVLPDTNATKHLINKVALENMRKDALLISVGRGATIDQEALIEALENQRIKAAVLDVFETEPLPADSKLWSLPNAFITPHVSGFYVSKKIFEIFAENYKLFISGQKLNYLIDFSKGY